MRFHPAQRVLVRGLPWKIARVPNPDVVEVVGLAPENFGQRARFLVPVDRPSPAGPAPPPAPAAGARRDPARLQALFLAFEIGCSFGPDRLGALAHGRIALEPYQLEPLLRLLSLPRPRLLIADDVGLGKTAEAGLILAELERRGKASRILVVCPASLTRPWRDALASRFGIEAEIFDEAAARDLRRRLPAHLNPWLAVPRVVASMDWAKQPHVLRALSPARWDAAVFDECHHFSARGEPPSQRARLASLVAARSEALLLLSATPHDGTAASFASLLRLLDLSLVDASGAPDPGRAPRHVVRRLKAGVTFASGGRFAERLLAPLSVRPEPAEDRLHREVSRYAEAFLDLRSGTPVGLVASILKKRLLSSPLALLRSLEARKARLEGAPPPEPVETVADLLFGDLGASAAGRAADRGREIEELGRLVELARPLAAGPDTKARALRGLLEAEVRGKGEKAVVFTEYRDTLDWLAGLFRDFQPLLFHGGLAGGERAAVLRAFRDDPSRRLLLATDAAGEGLDLQERCSLLVHFELPWNPNRIEQRNGRIDRYGAAKTPRIVHLHVQGRIESDLLDLLHRKLDRIRRELGSVADVLAATGGLDAEAFLLAAAGDPAEKMRELEALVDAEVERRRAADAAWNAGAFLAPSAFGGAEARAALEVLERSRGFPAGYPECRRLLEGFFSIHGGGIEETREAGVVRLRLPEALAGPRRAAAIERATFGRAEALRPGNEDVEFLSPAHPVVREALEAMKGLLLDPSFGPRACARRGARDGALFVFLQRFADGRGEAVEERLEPVFAPRAGPPSRDAEGDRALLWAGDGAAEAVPGWATRGWDGLLASARREEKRRRRARAAALEAWAAERARARMEAVSRRRREILACLASAPAAPAPEGLELFAPLYEEEASSKAAEEIRRAEAELEEELEGLDASAWVEGQEAELIGAWVLVRA